MNDTINLGMINSNKVEIIFNKLSENEQFWKIINDYNMEDMTILHIFSNIINITPTKAEWKINVKNENNELVNKTIQLNFETKWPVLTSILLALLNQSVNLPKITIIESAINATDFLFSKYNQFLHFVEYYYNWPTSHLVNEDPIVTSSNGEFNLVYKEYHIKMSCQNVTREEYLQKLLIYSKFDLGIFKKRKIDKNIILARLINRYKNQFYLLPILIEQMEKAQEIDISVENKNEVKFILSINGQNHYFIGKFAIGST